MAMCMMCLNLVSSSGATTSAQRSIFTSFCTELAAQEKEATVGRFRGLATKDVKSQFLRQWDSCWFQRSSKIYWDRLLFVLLRTKVVCWIWGWRHAFQTDATESRWFSPGWKPYPGAKRHQTLHCLGGEAAESRGTWQVAWVGQDHCWIGCRCGWVACLLGWLVVSSCFLVDLQLSSVKNLQVRNLTKLVPWKWNPRPRKRAEALAEADADRPIAEGPRKTISTYNLHEELVFAEAPRKQNQLTHHPRKLKLWLRKQRGRPRGRQVGLEENYIEGFSPPLNWNSPSHHPTALCAGLLGFAFSRRGSSWWLSVAALWGARALLGDGRVSRRRPVTCGRFASGAQCNQWPGIEADGGIGLKPLFYRTGRPHMGDFLKNHI